MWANKVLCIDVIRQIGEKAEERRENRERRERERWRERDRERDRETERDRERQRDEKREERRERRGEESHIRSERRADPAPKRCQYWENYTNIRTLEKKTQVRRGRKGSKREERLTNPIEERRCYNSVEVIFFPFIPIKVLWMKRESSAKRYVTGGTTYIACEERSNRYSSTYVHRP
jgi:hypothetical protein